MVTKRPKAGYARGSVTLLGLAMLAGCGISPAPIAQTRHIVAAPRPGEVAISAQPIDSVGEVMPIFVTVSNGTAVPRDIVPSQVFALDANGERIAPIPPGEAARQAGNAENLKAALLSAGVSGVAGGALGTALGAGAGAVLGNTAGGAVLGGAIGGGYGAFRGAQRGQQQAERQAEVRKDFTISGYVFFPKGLYAGIEMLTVNSENGNTEILKAPLR